MLKKELLEMLNCPKCKGVLEAVPDENNRKNGQLICHQCKLAYPVLDGLTNMGLDAAKPLDKLNPSDS